MNGNKITTDETLRAALNQWADAEISEDSDGQLVIHTGVYLRDERTPERILIDNFLKDMVDACEATKHGLERNREVAYVAFKAQANILTYIRTTEGWKL